MIGWGSTITGTPRSSGFQNGHGELTGSGQPSSILALAGSSLSKECLEAFLAGWGQTHGGEGQEAEKMRGMAPNSQRP